MNASRVVFLVHGGPASVEAVRAQGLASRLPGERVAFLYREGPDSRVARHWWRELDRLRPALVYVVNTAMPGALLAPWWSRRHGLPYVLDTGDAIYEMERAAGMGPRWRLPLLRFTEAFAQRRAAAIVVRGTRHQEFLQAAGYRRVERIRDGFVDRGPVPEAAVAALRERWGMSAGFVVGVLGSLAFSPRLRICYGWDLVEALAALPDLPVQGLVVGDGNGLPFLQERAAALGVADRIRFAGRIPYPDVPAALRVMDIALSTQTNNLPGQVRTTGKLPEYMAAGRFVLASRVGEAALLLPESMLVQFQGTVDRAYPGRLAARIREVYARPDWRGLAATLPEKARALCSYEVLSGEFLRLAVSLAPALGVDVP